MEYLVTAKQMQACDRATSEYFKVPGVVLMERAALACVELIKQRQEQMAVLLPEYKFRRRTLVVAGCGSNGGDGLAIGRLLMQEGYPVDFWLPGGVEKCTGLCAQQAESVTAYGGKLTDVVSDAEYDIIIDAIQPVCTVFFCAYTISNN